MAGFRGRELARQALGLFGACATAYPDGIAIAELVRELRLAGHAVEDDDPFVVLPSTLNDSQAHGLWARQDGGLWRPGTGASSKVAGLTGRPLAAALHEFVQRRRPGGVFHYEGARLALAKTGVKVKGTGKTTIHALESAPEWFARVEGQPGMWRWT